MVLIALRSCFCLAEFKNQHDAKIIELKLIFDLTCEYKKIEITALVPEILLYNKDNNLNLSIFLDFSPMLGCLD